MASRMSCPWFVGRTEELRQLSNALDATVAGSSATVLVGGDAGIGKSRLVAELTKRASAAGAAVVSGQCLDVAEGGAPYAPVQEVLAQLSGHRPDPGLGDEPTPDARPAEALPAALRRRAAERPVVLVIEDVHWADRSTRDLITVLAGGRELPGVMLVATYRADGLERGDPVRGLLAELDRAERVHHVRLAPFGPGDLTDQLRGILGRNPSESLVGAVLERSDGNPFFAEELAAVSGEGDIPPGLHELLLARLDRLDKGSQAVVRAAAVAGRRVGHRLLAAAVELPTEVVDAGLRAARQHHLLLVDEQGYAFRHALVHEAVLGELLPGERAAMHAAYARAIDVDHGLVGASWAAALVHHWSSAGRNDRAAAPALAAAVDAELAYALPEAQRYYDWLLGALDAAGDADVSGTWADLPVTRAELVDRAADVASRAGDLDRAAKLIGDALADFDPQQYPARAAILHERRGWCLLQRGRGDDALKAYEEAIGLVPLTPPTAARARVLAASADALERIDRIEEAASRAAEAVSVAVAARTPGDEGHARHTLGAALAAGGDLDGGLAELRRALDLAVRGSDIADAAGIHRHLWRFLVAERRAAEMVDTAVADAARARATGMPVLAGVLEAIAAGYCHQLGRWEEAESLLADPDPQRVDGIVQLVVGSLIDTDRGDVERAGDRLESVRAGTLGLRDGRIDGLLFRGLAERAWSRGQLDAVAGVVEEGLQRTTDPEMTGWLALVALRAADAGSGDEVERWGATLRRLAGYADERGLGPAAELRSLGATGEAELSRIRGPAAPDRWAEAVAAWDRTGFPHPGAYCRWRQGEAVLAAGGSRDEAAALFAAAGAAAVGLGARPLAAAIEQSARRARLPAPTATATSEAATERSDGTFGITSREREVLELLARGWTNKQIAEALFISEKTARVHVSHLLTKLAVPTRGAAVDVAHRHGLLSS
jgi:DNA-binding CsgD family transcriptional regulator/tetratricopeptide (TPR) repeat protein